MYAATSPDGKVYRITGNGKPEVFYDPEGEVHLGAGFRCRGQSVRRDGRPGRTASRDAGRQGQRVFQDATRRTYGRWRSMAKGNLIVGTEPGGLVLRVSPAGEGFVLYQMPKREVTAVAQAPDGAIYAAAVGNRQPTPGARDAAAGSDGSRTAAGGGGGGRQCGGGAATFSAAAFDGADGSGGRQRSVPHRSRWRAAARVGTCAGRGVRDRVRRLRPRAAGRGEQGQHLPHRIAHHVYVAAGAAGDAGHGVPGGPRRPAVCGHGEYGQGVRDWSGAGARRFDRERRVRFRPVFAVGAAQFRSQSERRAGRDGDAQRQPGPAAEELERVGARCRAAPRAAAWPRRRRASCSGKRR